MVSDFRKKKYLHVFNTLFDSDKSGTVDKNDVDSKVNNIAAIKGLKPGDAKYQQIKETLTRIFDKLQERADKDKDGSVSVDEWIAMCEDYGKNPQDPNHWQNDYMKFIFECEDSSNDGSIDAQEFSSVYASFGLSKDEAIKAFNKLSKGKSSVSWAEFQELWQEYFSTDDPNAPGNFIFGKVSF